MKRHIPNIITLFNLVSGVSGILLVISGRFDLAVGMILLASVFDFIDGFAARLLKAGSETGRQLDSLADVTSFGTLPAVLIYSMLSESQVDTLPGFLPFLAVLLPCSSAYRLAIFHNDPEQSSDFKGLPTPASALFFAGLLMTLRQTGYMDLAGGILCLYVSIFLISWLQISRLPMLSLKPKKTGKREKIFRIALLVFSLVIIMINPWIGIMFAVGFYIFLSLILSGKKPNSG